MLYEFCNTFEIQLNLETSKTLIYLSSTFLYTTILTQEYLFFYNYYLNLDNLYRSWVFKDVIYIHAFFFELAQLSQITRVGSLDFSYYMSLSPMRQCLEFPELFNIDSKWYEFYRSCSRNHIHYNRCGVRQYVHDQATNEIMRYQKSKTFDNFCNHTYNLLPKILIGLSSTIIFIGIITINNEA